MSSSLAEVFPWYIAYVIEQNRFWRDCACAQDRLNLCCSHNCALVSRFPWRGWGVDFPPAYTRETTFLTSYLPIYAEWTLLSELFGPVHFQFEGCLVSFDHCQVLLPVVSANSVDTDQTPRSAASDLGLHCLPMSHLWDARHKWVIFLHAKSLLRKQYNLLGRICFQ